MRKLSLSKQKKFQKHLDLKNIEEIFPTAEPLAKTSTTAQPETTAARIQKHLDLKNIATVTTAGPIAKTTTKITATAVVSTTMKEQQLTPTVAKGMINFSLYNIAGKHTENVLRKSVGIGDTKIVAIGDTSLPFLANLEMFPYEYDYIKKLYKLNEIRQQQLKYFRNYIKDVKMIY